MCLAIPIKWPQTSKTNVGTFFLRCNAFWTKTKFSLMPISVLVICALLYCSFQQSWQGPPQQQQHYHHQQDPQLLPSNFQLRTPPLGRRCRRSLILTNSQGQGLGLEAEMSQSQAEQRAEAVSRLKLLPMPGQLQEQVRNKGILVSQETLVSGMLLYKVQQWCAAWYQSVCGYLFCRWRLPQMFQIF